MASSSLFCSYSSLLFLILFSFSRTCYGFGTFGFDIHHRYSDPVKGILSLDDDDNLPEKGTPHYYASLSHRDRLIHGRKLAAADNSTPLTFVAGNDTYRFSSLGFLHYANVSVGTPSLSFLVALDTGSDLFWLPCDCKSCVHGLQSSSGQEIDFNIYSPNTSSTSKKILCNNDSLCPQANSCSSPQSSCPYHVEYLSNGTGSSGYLVEDVLHLISNDAQSKALDAKIKFGCGQIQTGSFLDGAAPNGLFGLGMTNVSVPSTLAREGYTSNSFSMCFGPDGTGRISFGDTGSADQGETPFNLKQPHPTYNVSITNINVEGKDSSLEFYAIFDSGTSFTYLNDPAYSAITKNFNSAARDGRYASASNSGLPFEYCYTISGANVSELLIPTVNLEMKGGSQYNVTDPIVIVNLGGNNFIYCLGVVKSGDVNIIGQNFMTGYNIIFNRERNVLGWKPSDCYEALETNTMPIGKLTPAVPPATAVNPEATINNNNNTNNESGANHSSKLNHFSITITMVLFILLPFFIIV